MPRGWPILRRELLIAKILERWNPEIDLVAYY